MSKQVDKQAEATLLQKITDLGILFNCPDSNSFDVIALFNEISIIIQELNLSGVSISLELKINDYVYPLETLTIQLKINDYIFVTESITIDIERVLDFSYQESLSMSLEITSP